MALGSILFIVGGVALAAWLFLAGPGATPTNSQDATQVPTSGPIVARDTSIQSDPRKGLELQLDVARGPGRIEIDKQIAVQGFLTGVLSAGKIEWRDRWDAALKVLNVAFLRQMFPGDWSELHYVYNYFGWSPAGSYRTKKWDEGGSESFPEWNALANARRILESEAPPGDVYTTRKSRGFFVGNAYWIDTSDTARFGSLDFGVNRVYWSPDANQVLYTRSTPKGIQFALKPPHSRIADGAAQENPLRWTFFREWRVVTAESGTWDRPNGISYQFANGNPTGVWHGPEGNRLATNSVTVPGIMDRWQLGFGGPAGLVKRSGFGTLNKWHLGGGYREGEGYMTHGMQTYSSKHGDARVAGVQMANLLMLPVVDMRPYGFEVAT